MKTLARRLLPGSYLLEEILSLVEDSKIKSGIILSLVGSLEIASLRMAGQEEGVALDGPFEITSATGTVGNGAMHLHITVSDEKGVTTGGHLMPGSKIYTTVELVIMDTSSEWSFEREHCELTGYSELAVKSSNQASS